MIKLVIIRPEPGASATLEAASKAGLEAITFPLSDVRPVQWQAPDPAAFDALLVGSANAFRHAGPQLGQFMHLPVHAVGKTTAKTAEESGFRVERVGEGGLQELLDRVIGPIRYLRLAGAEHVELSVAQAISIDTRIVYEVANLPMPKPLVERLRAGNALVLLHSAAAARHFASEFDRLGLDRSIISLATIGPRVSAAAGDGWQALRAAPQPNDAALLALAADMCH